MTDEPKSTFARRVRAAKPRAKKYDVWDDVISGLGLRVGTSGHLAAACEDASARPPSAALTP